MYSYTSLRFVCLVLGKSSKNLLPNGDLMLWFKYHGRIHQNISLKIKIKCKWNLAEHRSRAIGLITTLQMGCTEGCARMTISQTDESHLPPRKLTKYPPKVILLSCKPCSPDSGGWLGHGVELIQLKLIWLIDEFIETYWNNHLGNINQLIPTIWFDLIGFTWLIHCLVDCFIWVHVIWLIDGLVDWWVYLIWFDLIWFDLIWFDLIDWLIDCHCVTYLSLILDLSSVCL